MNCLQKVVLAVAAAALLIGFSISAQAKEWRGWNIHVAGYPNTVAMDKFAELLKEKSGGKLSVKMYHAGTLGSQPDAIEQVRLGGLEIGNTWADLHFETQWARQQDDVAADEVESPQAPHEKLRLDRREPAHLRRAGARNERRVEYVEVKGNKQVLGTVFRFLDDILHHWFPAATLDFSHRVIAESFLAHPVERFLVRVVASQAHLDVVLGRHQALGDQAFDPSTVSDQVPHHHGGVVVSIEVDNAYVTFTVNVGSRSDRGVRDGVIATDHEAGDREVDDRLVEFARGADHLFHDAQYTPQEHVQLYEGWGHSTWQDAVATGFGPGDVGRLPVKMIGIP